MAWHYATASAAGVAEGTVSLAWAHVHGVGVPRNLTAASHMLSHAMHNAVDDEESVARPATRPMPASPMSCWNISVRYFVVLGGRCEETLILRYGLEVSKCLNTA